MKTFAIGVSCVLMLASPAYGQTSLSLPEALSLARKNNRDLVAARARLLEAKAGVEQAWTALLPTVSAQGKYTHNYKGAALNLGEFGAPFNGLVQTLKGANGAAPPSAQNPALTPALNQFLQQLNQELPNQSIVIQKQEQLDSYLNVSVPLVNLANYTALSSARKTFAASEANFQVTETTLLLSVAQAFYATAGTDELLLARKDAVDVAKRTLNITQARFSAGTVKRTDVNQAQLALLRAQQALLEASDSRNQAYRALATLLQKDEAFQVATIPTPETAASAEDLTRQALATRPELHAYLLTADADRQQVDSAKLRWAPSLSAFGNAHYGNYAGFTGDDYSWAVGLQLDWLLYDGGARDAQRHLAHAQLLETEAHLAGERDSIRDEIRNDLENVGTRREGLATATESVALARETLALSRAEYDAGTATQLDVLEAQDALIGAEVAQAQARFDLALAKLNLDRSAGAFPEAVK